MATSDLRGRESDAAFGELLRSARLSRGLTLQQISDETRISVHHLESLERENLGALPGDFYRRAQTRAYARAVGLDPDLALARLERALALPAGRQGGSRDTSKPRASMWSRQRLLIAAVVIVAGVALGRAIGGSKQNDDDDGAAQQSADVPTPVGDAPRESAPEDSPVTPSPIGATSSTVADVNEGAPAAAAAAPSIPPAAPAAVAAQEPPSDESAVVGPATVDSPEAQAPVSSSIAATSEIPAEPRVTAPPANGLVVSTRPAGARVTVNGIGWGVTPVSIRYLPIGEKRVRVSKDGYVTEERVITVAEGDRQTVDITLQPAP